MIIKFLPNVSLEKFYFFKMINVIIQSRLHCHKCKCAKQRQFRPESSRVVASCNFLWNDSQMLQLQPKKSTSHVARFAYCNVLLRALCEISGIERVLRCVFVNEREKKRGRSCVRDRRELTSRFQSLPIRDGNRIYKETRNDPCILINIFHRGCGGFN